MISDLKKYTILYVEDEPEIQANIAEYLSNYFSSVYLSQNGKDAIKLYAQYRPDAVFLDINIPYIDGLEVAREIRKQDDFTKIIMLTAFTEEEKLLKATELKLTKYLVKPVSPNDFKEALECLVKEFQKNPVPSFIIKNNYRWNINNRCLMKDNKVINLGEKEHRLLSLFVTNKGKTISYERIMSELWGDVYDKEISINSVKNIVSKLRNSLPTDCILNVYGEGYILR